MKPEDLPFICELLPILIDDLAVSIPTIFLRLLEQNPADTVN
jgi:hypothetical protein